MHVIRLRKPWQKTGPSGHTEVIDIPEPASNQASSGVGRCVYRRSFNTPTGLDSDGRVFLRIARWQGRLDSLAINDQPLIADASEPLHIDITKHLRQTNVIVVELVDDDSNAARLSGEVTLAIG